MFKGPVFLVQDTKKDKKLVLLNQHITKDWVFFINENQKYEFKDLGNGQGMLNIAIQDSIGDLVIKGIWSQDPNLRNIYKALCDEKGQ